MNIVQVYAPTKDIDDNMIKEFYTELETMKLTKKGEITIMMGDFNVKMGVGAAEGVVGNLGPGDMNSR